jgi:hypothetical protein
MKTLTRVPHGLLQHDVGKRSFFGPGGRRWRQRRRTPLAMSGAFSDSSFRKERIHRRLVAPPSPV